MALVISMREGQSFYLNDLRVTVDRIHTPNRVTLEISGMILKKMTIGPNHRTELIPEVYASIGTDSLIDTVKIALEAPRNVTILRESLYAAAQDDS